MCGLVGAAFVQDEKHRSIFSNLLLNNVTRGPHSTGVLSMYTVLTGKDEGDYYAIERSMLPSSAFIFTPDYNAIIKKDPKFLAGHSRFATKGKINEDNCHPFEVGKVIGMHNGTIHGGFEGSNKYETDSEALFALINKYTLPKTLDIIHKDAHNVAYAIVYYDRRDQTVNIIRNDQRPLCYARHLHIRNRIFWSSESLMLQYALMREGMSKEYEIEVLKPGTLIKIHPFRSVGEERLEIIDDFYTPPKKSYKVYSNREWSGMDYGYGYTPDQYKAKVEERAKTSVPEVKRTGGYSDITAYLEKVQKEEDANESTTKEKIVSILDKKKRAERENQYYRIGTYFCNEVQIEDALKKGCMICEAPSVIINDNLNSIRFLPDQATDHVCKDCYDKHGPQDLGLTYGLFNLEVPKKIEKHHH